MKNIRTLPKLCYQIHYPVIRKNTCGIANSMDPGYNTPFNHLILAFVKTVCVWVLSIGTPEIINFPFGTNEKLMVLGVLIFKHISLRTGCFYSKLY